MSTLASLEERALADLHACTDEATLRAWKTRYLNDEVEQAVKKVSTLPPAERPAYGKQANELKKKLTAEYEAAVAAEKERALARSLASEALDVTLPGRPARRGRLHVSTQTLRSIFSIFGVLLRTHTSPGQIHVMRELCPKPIRVILPGMCYRYEAITTRSEIMFHQVEGLAIGERVTMADLKGTLIAFARRMFGEERKVRIRSSYFPFTEPSIEVDMDCIVCAGAGCSLCKRSGWLEILGAGMVHPVVLRNGGYDPARYSGFAFGMGVERTVMMTYAIDDIRQFWANDLRFLRQFGT
jgi:phenylalanyl-tRNA synthetase alpha chain